MARLDEGEQRTPGRRVYSVRLEASRQQLRGLLDELAHLKVLTNVRDLHLQDRGSAQLVVSFRLIVYDNAPKAIDAVLTPS